MFKLVSIALVIALSSCGQDSSFSDINAVSKAEDDEGNSLISSATMDDIRVVEVSNKHMVCLGSRQHSRGMVIPEAIYAGRKGKMFVNFWLKTQDLATKTTTEEPGERCGYSRKRLRQ